MNLTQLRLDYSSVFFRHGMALDLLGFEYFGRMIMTYKMSWHKAINNLICGIKENCKKWVPDGRRAGWKTEL